MVRFFHSRFLSTSRKGTATILALILCSGYCAGSFIGKLSCSSVSSMMCMAVTSRVMIISLLSVISLPFIVTVIAVYLRQNWLILVIAFFRSVSFSYLGSCILCSYAFSGWLVLFLFLFSDCISLLILCWLWVHVLKGDDIRLRPRLSVVFVLLLVVVSLDCHYISPFLVSLLS